MKLIYVLLIVWVLSLARMVQAAPTLSIGDCEESCVGITVECELEVECATATFTMLYGPELTVTSTELGADLDPELFGQGSLNRPADGRLRFVVFPIAGSSGPTFPSPSAEVARACFSSEVDACHPLTLERNDDPVVTGFGSDIGDITGSEGMPITLVDGGVGVATHVLSISPCVDGPPTQAPQAVSCQSVTLAGAGVVSLDMHIEWDTSALTFVRYERGSGLFRQVIQTGVNTDGLLDVHITPDGAAFPIETFDGQVLRVCFSAVAGGAPGCTPVSFAFGAELGDNVGQPIPVVTRDGGAYLARMGDANGDGYCDGADYTIWADHFGQPPVDELGYPMGPSMGDFNGDGLVDGADYTSWADNFTE